MPETIFPDGMSESTKELITKITKELLEKRKERKVRLDSIAVFSEEDIVYVEDSPYAREWLSKHFQGPEISLKLFRAYCYIKFNTKTFDWTPTMWHQWLYVPQPKLEELESLLLYKN